MPKDSDLAPAAAAAPAYATYPRPEWFVEAFDANVLNAWLATPRVPHMHGAIAIELRLPAASEDGYLSVHGDCVSDDACFEWLVHEMALYQSALGSAPGLGDLRWSSGCATLPRLAMRRLHHELVERFGPPSETGFSAHIDPLAHDPGALAALRTLDAYSVQIGAETTHRFDKPAAALVCEQTAALVASAHDAGFTAIEAAYRIGAPERLGSPAPPALDALIAAGPTRIVLSDVTPPNNGPTAKSARPYSARPCAPAAFVNAAARLAHAGYVCIAESLFALAADPYSIAHRQGRLSCRAGGYAVHPSSTVLGLGPGAIGQVGPFYYQNFREPERYFAALDAGRLPIERGLHLSHGDLARRAVIASLATNLFVDVPAVEAAFGIDFDHTFATELGQLRAYAKARLLTIDDTGINLTRPGHLACGTICQVFDAYSRQRIEKMPQTSLL